MKTINIIIVLFLISFSNFAQTGPRVSPSGSHSTTGGRAGDNNVAAIVYERLVLSKQELSFKIQKSDGCSQIIGVSLKYEEDDRNVRFRVTDRSIFNLKPEGDTIVVKVKLDEIIHDKKVICTIAWNLNGCNELTAQGKPKFANKASMTESVGIKADKSISMEADQSQKINKTQSNAIQAEESSNVKSKTGETPQMQNLTKPKSNIPQARQARQPDNIPQARQARQPDNESVPPVTTYNTNTTEVWGLHIYQQDVAVPTRGKKKD